MKTPIAVGLALTLALSAACSDTEPTAVPMAPDAPARNFVANGAMNGVAQLSGANEVPSRDTRARGLATVQVSADGTELSYRLIVANIDNVIAAHFHLGEAGVNGPVVAFLYGPAPAGQGAVNGPIAEGVITDADLIGPFAGQTLATLVQAMVDGSIYVNVHTSDGVAPTNTGPGDFASGEVRGQVR
jgi:hypothetical protein